MFNADNSADSDDPVIGVTEDLGLEREDVVLELRCAGMAESSIVEFWDELISSILDGISFGLIAENLDGGIPPSGKLLSTEVVRDPLGWAIRYTCSMAGVPLAGWRVILQTLFAASSCSYALLEIVTRTQHRSERRVLKPLEVFAASYLSAPEPSEYTVLYESDGRSDKERAVRIQFKISPTPDIRRSIDQAFKSWMVLVNGGYPRNGEHSTENACDAVTTDWHETDTVECFAENYLGDEAGFAAALRMVDAIHRWHCPVKEVEIE